MENFHREEWLFLYYFALVELAQARMSGRVSAAQQAIAARLERLRTMPELHREERHAMQDAARTLTFLEREAERFDAKAESGAIEESMQQPASDHPTIQQLVDPVDAASL